MTSHLKGPSEGEWSVFAEKVVGERDQARAEVNTLAKRVLHMTGAVERYRERVLLALEAWGERPSDLRSVRDVIAEVPVEDP